MSMRFLILVAGLVSALTRPSFGAQDCLVSYTSNEDVARCAEKQFGRTAKTKPGMAESIKVERKGASGITAIKASPAQAGALYGVPSPIASNVNSSALEEPRTIRSDTPPPRYETPSSNAHRSPPSNAVHIDTTPRASSYTSKPDPVSGGACRIVTERYGQTVSTKRVCFYYVPH